MRKVQRPALLRAIKKRLRRLRKEGRRRPKVKPGRKPQRSAGQGYEGSSHSHPALAGWQRKKIPPNRFNGFVARSKPLKRLIIRQCSLTATQLKQGVNEKQTIRFNSQVELAVGKMRRGYEVYQTSTLPITKWRTRQSSRRKTIGHRLHRRRIFRWPRVSHRC